MFKKGLIIALFSVIMTMGMGTTVLAEINVPPVEYDTSKEMTAEIAAIIESIEKANVKIYTEIDKVQVKTNEMYKNYLEELKATQGEAQKVALWEKYDSKITEEIKNLDMKTQSITKKEVEKARIAGVTVEVVWITVKFADREAKIDPMVGVGW
ncbi:hypothetical protein B481_2518 [Planococcus halocryophilus Or1]|uniref:Uncharacterized protein n=1 Tax=Planococcus halocryophilus TaxID=1215089 RepID=A0A1C7DT14_9BACL|nr:hypothetical protein [Planococcus halocryophilus]ANU14323.1 hypothetical protein BBI08_10795 [Planococcus halocryophilus]EMF45948.1 hypothetical protein B481_2518 [Planococcus halocryophilus Or1]